MAETELVSAWGPITVRRRHTPRSSPLRAWASADELLLADLDRSDLGRLLVVNDSWGALSCGLAQSKPIIWSDSALARDSIESNLGLNASSLDGRFVAGNEMPDGDFDTVVLRLPKSVALLDWQVRHVATRLRPDARVICAAMTRHIGRAAIEVLEKRLGPVTQRRAERKARIIDVVPDPALCSGHHQVGSELPTSLAFRADEGIAVHQAPGVFSSGHVDIGTALLLEVLGASVSAPNGVVADLGCGNGVISATLGSRWPDASFELYDVSYLAVEAARATWQANGLALERASFHAADGFGSTPPEPRFDMVISNPPSHQDHAVDSALTDRLLSEAAKRLSPEGIAVIVAQRHMELHWRLRRWFTSVEVRSKHPSHVVFVAQHREHAE